MLLTIAPAALLPLVAVIALAGERTHRMLSDEAFRYAQAVAAAKAGEIGAILGEKTAALRTIAQTFSEYRKIPAPLRRRILSELLKAAYRSQSEVKAVWTQWEPGAIEDDPELYRGSLLSAPNGGFNATWYRTPKGIMQGRVTDEAYSKEFYLEPKRRLTPVLTKPYLYSYTGKPEDATMETTIGVPIFWGGEVKGVVGFDIEVATYKRMAEAITIFGTGYAVLVTSDGIRISHPVAGLEGTLTGDDLPPDQRAEFLRLIATGDPFMFIKKARASGADSRVFGVPIRAGTALPHWMLFLVVPVEEVTRQAEYAFRTLIALGFAAVVTVLGAILGVARWLSRPISSLTKDIEIMADRSKPGKLEVKGVDELASLASSFNTLSERLGSTLDGYYEANRQLENLNAGLERKVSERTADLERTLKELRAAQDHMIKAEKFALLGRLSAAVAHELNTPLGAVKSSADFLLTYKEETMSGLVSFSVDASPAEKEAFIRILRRGAENAKQHYSGTDRKGRRRFVQELEARGYRDAEEVVNDAETLGALVETADIILLLDGGKRKAIATAAKMAAEVRAEYIIKISADKAAATVSSLVSYARTEEFDIDETVDTAKEIDGLLVLYYGKMKSLVTIVRDYQCKETIPGMRDRLNQVWVNLINNALQSMKDGGTLEIMTKQDGDFLVVSIIDSGPGIPEAIKSKIFTPFFTTKPAGEGTGLGLDICRKIVERHGGTIGFESVPGRTVFTVRLPLKGATQGSAR